MFFALVLASPPLAAWMIRGDASTPPDPAIHPVSLHSPAPAEGAVQVPVEVVTKGSASKWVYVAVAHQTIPEPGVVSLLGFASLLLLRRQRMTGK